MYCTNCGNKLEKNINFCGNCGLKVTTEDNKIKENIDSKIVNESIDENKNKKVNQTSNDTKNEKKEEFIKTDFLDILINKKINYTKESLSEERFKVSHSFMYILSLFSLIFGFILYFTQSDTSQTNLSGSVVIIVSLFYIIFTFIFDKLKMPIMLSFLLIGMLIEKIYSTISLDEFKFMSVVVIIILIIGIIQSIRCSKYLKNKNKKMFKTLSIIGFIITVSIYLMYISHNKLEDTYY